MKTKILGLLALVAVTTGQEQFKCPDEFEGYYPHLTSCDKYWHCDNDVAELRTCGNGLAFVDTDPSYTLEQCAELHLVECGARTDIEPPISTTHCPRLYGTFADAGDCGIFWKCIDGKPNQYQCPPGLAYDQEERGCRWADQVPECANPAVVVDEEGGEFQCPRAGPVGAFTKHAHPADCRQYFVCIGGTPREYGCPLGQVFSIGGDDFSGKCTDPEEVAECRDYYGDLEFNSVDLARNGADTGRLGPSEERARSRGVSRTVNRPSANEIRPAPAKTANRGQQRVEVSRPAPPELQSIVDTIRGASRPAPPPPRPAVRPAPVRPQAPARPAPPRPAPARPAPARPAPARPAPPPRPQPTAAPAPIRAQPTLGARPAPTIPPRLTVLRTETTSPPRRPTTLQQQQDEPQTTLLPRFTATSRPRTSFSSIFSSKATNPVPSPTTTALPATTQAPPAGPNGLPPPVKAAPGPDGEEYYYYYYYYDDEEAEGGEGGSE